MTTEYHIAPKQIDSDSDPKQARIQLLEASIVQMLEELEQLRPSNPSGDPEKMLRNLLVGMFHEKRESDKKWHEYVHEMSGVLQVLWKNKKKESSNVL